VDYLGLELREEQVIFIYSQSSSLALGPTKPPVQLIPGFFPGSKAVRRDVDHSSPPSTEVKVSGTITVLPLYTFTSWTSTTQSYYFTLQKHIIYSHNHFTHIFKGKKLQKMGSSEDNITK